MKRKQKLNSQTILFSLYIINNKIDVIAVTETWFKDIPDDLILLSGFKCHRRDRNDSSKTKGGGVSIFVRNHIKMWKSPQKSGFPMS